jgi:hypothetical protein
MRRNNMSKEKKEIKKYTCEMMTSKGLIKAKKRGSTPEIGRRRTTNSMFNKWNFRFPEEFNRFSIEGIWLSRPDLEVKYPLKYDELLFEVESRIRWTYDLQQNIGHGIISHSAMRDAVKAVMA